MMRGSCLYMEKNVAIIIQNDSNNSSGVTLHITSVTDLYKNLSDNHLRKLKVKEFK